MSIGIFLPNWVGDVVMATPALRAMRRHFGAQYWLVGIGRPHLADLLSGTDFLDEFWPFEPKGDSPIFAARKSGQSPPARRGAADPAETPDRQVSCGRWRPPVAVVARSGDRPQRGVYVDSPAGPAISVSRDFK